VLLRASGAATGLTAEVAPIVEQAGDTGVPHGRALIGLTEAVCRRSLDVAAARAAVLAAVGPAGLVEAAATVGIFNGLVRVADGCGIPLDDGTLSVSAEDRAALGLDRYGGAANTDPGRTVAPPADDSVQALFR
jgi:hypothetical protein